MTFPLSKNNILIFGTLLGASLIAAGLYADNTPRDEAAITLTNRGFSPATILVPAGIRVVWKNRSGAPATVDSSEHPTHLDHPFLNLGELKDGGARNFSFPEPGIFKYHDHYHPERTGTIIVGSAGQEKSWIVQDFSDVGKTADYWGKRIGNIGAQAAYNELKLAYSDKDFTSQHIAAHLFGNLLYEKLGVEGFYICDEALGFGCHHNFVSRALAERGLSAIDELNRACLAKFGERDTTCQHGIGHGVMEFLGYGDGALYESLDACDRIATGNARSGCAWGVFMAYNIRVVVGAASASITLRPLDPQNPYAPCPSVPERLRRVCISQLALWWDKLFSGDYGKMGEMCVGLKDEKDRGACVIGVGLVAATLTEYDIQKTVERCDVMPDAPSEIFCRAGASWSFRSYPGKKAVAPRLCDDAREEIAAGCKAVRPEKFLY